MCISLATSSSDLVASDIDTARTCDQYLSTSRVEDSLEHTAKIYHSLVLQRKLGLVVRWITEREKGGVIQPEDT